MIPKKIHYCWFGKGEKGKKFYKCYASWKKFFPDYEIIEWNELNFNINCNDYVKEAYKEKKYAFVSDYARLHILYNEGGIYFDTDVEVLKEFSDEILLTGYLAKETDKTINTGLGFAVQPKNEVIKLLRDSYQDEHFIENGKENLTTCVERTTNALNKEGIIIDENLVNIGNLKIFAPEFFCGYDIFNDCYLVTPKTMTVHHYKGSWLNKRKKMVIVIKRIISKLIGKDNYEKLRIKIKKVRGIRSEK